MLPVRPDKKYSMSTIDSILKSTFHCKIGEIQNKQKNNNENFVL